MRFETVRRYALALPGVVEQPHFQYASFRVDKKIFVTVPPGDHCLHVFASPDHREQALAMYPEWTEKVLWGGKVVGVRVLLAPAPAAAVKWLVRAAWQFKAARPRGRGTGAGG